MPEGALPFHAWIDTPSTTEVDSPCLCIRGWCYRHDSAPIRGVRAVLARARHPGSYGLPRPDVTKALGAAIGENTGFEISLLLPSRKNTLALEALGEDGTWTVFHTLTIRSTGKSQLQGWFRRLRFWTKAWLGNPEAFLSLPAAEQDFLLADCRSKGLLGLGELRQYSPRPVATESFPRSNKTPAELPKFTIVTPSFNQAAFLGKTARSVLEQEGVRIDYIVQDGGSTDGSAELLRELATKFPGREDTQARVRLAHWESKKDKGQSDAISKGFAHTDCGPDDLMAYLNSDDLLMPGVLSFVANWFARHPEVDAVYGHRVMIDDQDAEIGRWVTPRQACDNLPLMDLIPQETLFWRRRLWDKVGGIDTHFQFAMDWDLLLRFGHAGARIVRLPYFLALFRIHPQQKTQAWMGEHGLREMERLRARSLDRIPEPAELQKAMALAQFDSALVSALLRRGLRK